MAVALWVVFVSGSCAIARACFVLVIFIVVIIVLDVGAYAHSGVAIVTWGFQIFFVSITADIDFYYVNFFNFTDVLFLI